VVTLNHLVDHGTPFAPVADPRQKESEGLLQGKGLAPREVEHGSNLFVLGGRQGHRLGLVEKVDESVGGLFRWVRRGGRKRSTSVLDDSVLNSHSLLGTMAKSQCTADPATFDVINTEGRAYWLGFLMCDAHWSVRGIYVELSSKSKHHLESLCDWLSTPVERITTRTRTITFPNGTTKEHSTCTLLLPGRRWIREVGENPKMDGPGVNVPDNLLPHFWRGILDADGSICKRANQSSHGWLMALYGKEWAVGGFVKYLNSFAICNSKPKGDGRCDNMLRATSSNANTLCALYEKCYKGARHYLSNKMEKMEDMYSELKGREDGRFKQRV